MKSGSRRRPERLRSREPKSGHSPPSVAPGCPLAGGCWFCSAERLPPASRSSPCATSAGGFAVAPSGMGRSGCSGATTARPPGPIPPGSPPVAPPLDGSAGATRSPPRSPGPNALGRAGAAGATAPTGYLRIGKSAAAATLSMAKSAAVIIMMIFTMLIPLRLDTRTVDPSDAPIRPCQQ